MKKLTLLDGELLLQAWSYISRSEPEEEISYPDLLYNAFLRFLSIKGMRIIPPEIVEDERRILIRALSVEYVRELRNVVDPQKENDEADLVLMLMLATVEERRTAVLNLRKQGYSF